MRIDRRTFFGRVIAIGASGLVASKVPLPVDGKQVGTLFGYPIVEVPESLPEVSTPIRYGVYPRYLRTMVDVHYPMATVRLQGSVDGRKWVDIDSPLSAIDPELL